MEKGDSQGGNSSGSSIQQQSGGRGRGRSAGGRSSFRGSGRGRVGRNGSRGGRGGGRNIGGRRHHQGKPHHYGQHESEEATDRVTQKDATSTKPNNHHTESQPARHDEPKQQQKDDGGDHNADSTTIEEKGRGNDHSGRGRNGSRGGRGRGRFSNRNAGRHSGRGGRGKDKPEESQQDDKAQDDKAAAEAGQDGKVTSSNGDIDKNSVMANGNVSTSTNNKHTDNQPEGGRGGRFSRGRGSARGSKGRGGRDRGIKTNSKPTEKNDEDVPVQDIHAEVEPEAVVTGNARAGKETKIIGSTECTKDDIVFTEPEAIVAEGSSETKRDNEVKQLNERKPNASHYTSMESSSVALASSLSLPKPPPFKGGKGGPMILMRKNPNGTIDSVQNLEEEKKVGDDQNSSPPGAETKKKAKNKVDRKEKKAKRDKKRKEAGDDVNGEGDDDEESIQQKPPSETATQALKSLPAQEVSITASTKVKLKHNESSSASLSKLGEKEGLSKSKKGKSKKMDGTKAARKFNNDVRMCVERSDPEGMRTILRNKKNHQYALDAIVLETVMKAYLMAAMFDDALYCLRNCALPGSLSTIQTERVLTCLPQNLRNSSAYTAADMINALCMATEFDAPTSRTYFLRIVRGIALEFLEEATSARDRICSAPCERLVRSGVCVVDARLKRGKKATELVVVPGDQLGVFVPDSMESRGIQAGDAISILPYAGPYPMSAESLDRNMVEATVINTNPMVLRLQDKTNAALHNMLTEQVDGNVYRIDKLANRMGFNRQLSAAVAVASPIDPNMERDIRRPCPQLIQAITAMDENIDRAMKQPGGFGKTGQLTSTAALCSEAIPWSYQDENEDVTQDEIRQSSQLALEKYKALEDLNLSQRLAVEGATTNRLTLIQGPPGTGKTAVAIRILQHWARLAKSTPGDTHYPILATSDSNIAVDNLVEGCAAVGLSVVRLGRPEAIRPELLRHCIDRPPSSYNSNGQSYVSSSAYKERVKALKSAQVICCTCIGSGGDILDALTFDRVLVDEATQATEPAVLVPLMRGCRQLVLVGDHCQLPPTVLSTRAEEEGHGVPLFSRMVACGVPPFMLDTQYRMHPCIAMFPSDLFYGGKLQNGVTAPERRPLAGFPWPREEFPVAFIPVQGIEMDDGVSKYNELEAEAACRAVQALLEGGQCTVSDIAVCTPYAAQARLIRRMTRRLVNTNGPPYIEVSSVDGFQGREKEAVVFSAVRSNDYGAIGFTSDWRRVNVSFTRARRALIVIGNDLTLRRGDPDTWMPWLAWADAHGINMDKPGIPRGRYDPEQLRRVRGGTTAAEMLRDVLERQQAQLKSLQDKYDKAQKSTAGHIRGEERSGGIFNGVSDDGLNGGDKTLSLEEDLARFENTDGNWDDSDDEDRAEMHHSASVPTLTSGTSSARMTSEDGSEDTPTDAWDL